MGKKNNAKCTVCGKGYHKCLSCADKMAATPWKRYTDTSEHYKIYQILNGYFSDVFTKEEAKSRLENVDLSDLETLRDNIKETIKDIMGTERIVDEVIEEPAEEVQIEKEINLDELDDDGLLLMLLEEEEK